MNLPVTLRNDIVDFLVSLPDVNDSNRQQALINRASLDNELHTQIKFPGSTTDFFELLIPTLVGYGHLDDGRNALEAILESAKNFVGQDRKRYCDELIQRLSKVLSPDTPLPLQVKLHLEGDIQRFTSKKHKELVDTIATILDIGKESVRILHVIPQDSFYVIVELSGDSALKLVGLFKAKDERVLLLLRRFPVKSMDILDTPIPLISIEHLPPIHSELFGREKEKKLLNDAWDKPHTNILCFYEWGGAGKTTLVKTWLLERKKEDNFQGATRVYGWSFYNQGISGKRQISSEQFLVHALRWFGDLNPESSDLPKYKAERLTKLICQHRALLILDGLETLQAPVGERQGEHQEQGELKDEGIRVLLKRLADSNPGLCVITTRCKIPDLDSCGEFVKQIRLKGLSKEAGIKLLRRLGVQGEKKELADAVKKFKRHALTLSLLGKYIKKVYNGDIHQLKELPHQDGQAQSVIKSYEEWLACFELTNQSFKALRNENIPSVLLDKLKPLQHRIIQDKKVFLNAVRDRIGKEETERYQTVILKHADWVNNSPGLIMLYLMGTFDRPAKKRAIQRLYGGPIIKGLTTKTLQHRLEQDWDSIIDCLRELRLLSRRDKHNPDMLDCHPLIREYFGECLQEDTPDAWKEAHRRLFDYYRQIPTECPETLSDMEPLYCAVAHGCQAGEYQAALDEVFIRRIRRGPVHYSLWHLGAVSADLAVLSGFFVIRWTELVKNLNAEGQTSILNTELFKDLNDEGQTYILNEVGSIFRASGQLKEAKKIIRKSAELAAEKHLYSQAALSYKNLSQTLMSCGELRDAIETAEKSLDFAKEEGDWFLLYSGYSNYGRALHLAGEWEEAADAFHKMVQKAKDEGIHPRGLQAFCYCDFLLDIGKKKQAHSIAQTAVNESESVRDKGLSFLALGKSSFALNEFENAKTDLTKAVEEMHQSSRQDELPGALLALARLYRKQGNLEKADEHLKEAYEIAKNGGMEIHLADHQLEKAKYHLAMAKNTIDHMAYNRREREINVLLQTMNKAEKGHSLPVLVRASGS